MLFGKKKKSHGQQAHINGQMNGHGPAVDPSFIGRNTYFEGHINCEGELHVDGQVRGQVRASLCVIDRNGTVYGSIFGEVIHVRGRVTGPIQGGAVYIYAGAHIEGDVFNDSISIEPGAFLDGAIRRNQGQGTAFVPPQNQQAELPTLKPIAKGLRVVASDK
jgi:cytoskeletal protein CcmA (bactofilin family)